MCDDWRQIYRKPGDPAPKVGDMIPGMEKSESGQWVGVAAPVEAVELMETKPDGSRFYSVCLGESVRV
jgi:hypothetical protein